MIMNDFNMQSESLFIWDDVEKKGFPLTGSIYCIDLSELSHEQRLIIAGTNADEASTLIKTEGGSLMSLLEMSVRVFRHLIQGIYSVESTEKKQEIQEAVQRLLGQISFEDDSDE